MKKISNDDNFENYLNKFVNVEVNGVTKKFFVSEINSGSFVTDAGILNNYTTLGESTIQECDVCEDVCYNNIPVIKVMFSNVVDNSEGSQMINNYYGEIHELTLNGTSLGRINTTFQKGKHNEIWFVPYNPSEVIVSTTYASSSNSSIYNTVYSFVGNINSLVLSSFNASLLNKNDYNEISIRPVSAWNPVRNDGNPYMFNPPLSTAFFLSPLVTLDIHKILPLTSNTSSISCQSYTMHRFDNSSVSEINNLSLRYDPTYLSFFGAGGDAYVNNYMSAGCVFQTFSASFYYYDPCQISSPAYYPLDPNYYYTYSITDFGKNRYGVKFAYGWAGTIGFTPLVNTFPEGLPNNPILPLLRKYVFFNSPNINDKLYVFVGQYTKKDKNIFLVEEYRGDGYERYSTRNINLGNTNGQVSLFAYNQGGAMFTSKYANELFEGTFYALEDRTYSIGDDWNGDYWIVGSGSGGSIRFRQMRVYIDTNLETGLTTQFVSAGAVIPL